MSKSKSFELGLCEPKPAAITLAKYINGDDYDIAPLYKFAKKQR